MFLESISLKNFRCFDECTIQFNKKLTVIVGSNGTGKSTLLDAATIAAGTYIAALDGVQKYRIRKEDAAFKYYDLGSSIDVQPQYPVVIKASGVINGKNIKWERALNQSTGKDPLSNAKELTSVALEDQARFRSGDETLLLPLIAYYGTGRLWAQHKEKKDDAFANNSRINGYIDCLDGAANNKLMMRWFQKMSIQQHQRNNVIPELNAVCKAVEKCFSAITGYEDVKVQYNFDTNDLDVIYSIGSEKQRMPVNRLSDGYKCTLSLIADIAYRMALLNPQLLDRVLEETSGIVLIDEVDLHLHPQWQKRIISDLTEIFPRIQFIVSTHAPCVINSVRSENIVILDDKAIRSPEGEVYGKDTNTIVKGVMKSDDRPEKVVKLFKKFYHAIDSNELSAAEETLAEISSLIGSDDSELAGCYTKLKLASIKVKMNDQD